MALHWLWRQPCRLRDIEKYWRAAARPATTNSSNAAGSGKTSPSDLSPCSWRTSKSLESWARRFLSGKMENQLSIFTADFAMLAAKNRGKLIHSFSSGRPPRELAAHAFCMCCKSTGSASTGPWQSFGRSLLRLAKRRSRWHNCFRIRPDFARWTRESIYSITAPLSRALEVQKPLWLPGTAHGYHARTFGFLLDELVRRIAGKTLSQYWREIFARPLNLDLWIGLPEEENPRVATIYAAKSGRPPEPKQFYLDLVTPGTLARKTFYLSVRIEVC